MSYNKYGIDTAKAGEQRSQDALRHLQDAVHHKGPLPGVKDATEGDVGQQAEIPKVGSRDAPGG